MQVTRSEEIGKVVRNCRKDRKLTQRQLSKQAGVSERLLVSLELGEAPGIRFDKLQSILEALDLTLSIDDGTATPENTERAETNKAEAAPAQPEASEASRQYEIPSESHAKTPLLRLAMQEESSSHGKEAEEDAVVASPEAIKELIDRLSSSNALEGYAAFNDLHAISSTCKEVYPYMEHFLAMIDSQNAYIRERALQLIIANSRWDDESIVDKNIDSILSHTADPKPSVTRQFVEALPELARSKHHLRNAIVSALMDVDTTVYPSSTRPLVENDIKKTLAVIQMS